MIINILNVSKYIIICSNSVFASPNLGTLKSCDSLYLKAFTGFSFTLWETFEKHF